MVRLDLPGAMLQIALDYFELLARLEILRGKHLLHLLLYIDELLLALLAKRREFVVALDAGSSLGDILAFVDEFALATEGGFLLILRLARVPCVGRGGAHGDGRWNPDRQSTHSSRKYPNCRKDYLGEVTVQRTYEGS